MFKQDNFLYNIIRNENEIFIYIPKKINIKVKGIQLSEKNIVLNYENNKKFTIKNINHIYIDRIKDSTPVWIVEFDKEQILQSAYITKITLN